MRLGEESERDDDQIRQRGVWASAATHHLASVAFERGPNTSTLRSASRVVFDGVADQSSWRRHRHWLPDCSSGWMKVAVRESS